MKVVDELFTPGCPQCAVKHLSAALYHAAELGRIPHRLELPDSVVLIARAYINLGEVLIGYKSHLWFAVGLLQRAEERALTEVLSTTAARTARLSLEERGVNGVRDTMRNLVIDVHLDHAVMCIAHFDEAMRELPAFADEMRMDDLIGSIERVRKEYFDLPEVTVTEGETTTNEGGPEMATKKKACKGGSCSAKGAKCADKGGTTVKDAKTTKTAKTTKAAKGKK
jgi:hypothetical protein